jgi:hypothetical protein
VIRKYRIKTGVKTIVMTRAWIQDRRGLVVKENNKERSFVCRNARTERFEQKLQGLALVPHDARTDLQNLVASKFQKFYGQFHHYDSYLARTINRSSAVPVLKFMIRR